MIDMEILKELAERYDFTIEKVPEGEGGIRVDGKLLTPEELEEMMMNSFGKQKR